VHYLQHSQNKILVSVRTSFSLILSPFLIPEVKDFNNIKRCDILNSDKLSEPEISDSVSQIWSFLWYIESIGTSAKVVICSKIAPNLTGFRVQISCQYMQFGQIACMFRISHGFQCRQDRRYIAAICNSVFRTVILDIISFFGSLKFQLCWRNHQEKDLF
jgi:hypothetical protein